MSPSRGPGTGEMISLVQGEGLEALILAAGGVVGERDRGNHRGVHPLDSKSSVRRSGTGSEARDDQKEQYETPLTSRCEGSQPSRWDDWEVRVDAQAFPDGNPHGHHQRPLLSRELDLPLMIVLFVLCSRCGLIKMAAWSQEKLR